MDLIRAAIVGAPGTPYHDNLFFFDIYLPPEYPHEPPVSCFVPCLVLDVLLTFFFFLNKHIRSS